MMWSVTSDWIGMFALRAVEINAYIILKVINADYLYTKVPAKYTDFEIIKDKFKVIHTTAISLCMKNNITIRIFNINRLENLKKAIIGEDVGSLIK